MLSLLLACRPAVSPDSPASPGPQPVLEADRDRVDFGLVAVGETETRTLSLANTGDGDLHLDELTLSEGVFAWTDLGAVLLPPGHATDLTLGYTPSGPGDHSEPLLIESDGGLLQVQLVGQGLAPYLHASPSQVAFDTLTVGCWDEAVVELSNHGNADLNLQDVELVDDSGELRLVTQEQLPQTLAPNQTTSIWLRYEPLSEGALEASVVVHSDDPAQPAATLPVTASGVGEDWLTDRYELPRPDQVDLLFSVDWSPSMIDENAALMAHLDTLFDALEATGLDVQLAFNHADDGCFTHDPEQGAWITLDQDRADQIANATWMICGNDGTSTSCEGGGSLTERPFMQFEAALGNTDAGECNEGFLREDALLALVGITDEPEQSVNPYTYYVSLFQSLKADSDAVRVHAVAGDYPTGCDGAMAGTGLYEATVATGGLYLSICDDWGDILGHLGSGVGGSVTTGSFELSEMPVAASLEVQVDGSLAEGWTYNEVDNSVDFSEDSRPAGGSTVEIRYATRPDGCP